MLNLIKLNDLDFGMKKEISELDKIRNRFSNSLKPTKNFFVFDYVSKDCYVELKSRRNKLNTYPDTMVGKNKMEYAESADRPVYFVFSFIDGLYYWKYNKEDIQNGNVKFSVGGRCDRGREEYKTYAYISTKILQLI
jgi:hypothetical protein